MVTQNGMVRGLESVLDRLDRRCRESEQIFGDLQPGNVTHQLLANLQSKLARPVAQLWQYLDLADPSFSEWLTSSRSAPGRIATQSRGSPKVKERLSRRYHLDRFDAATTLAQIESALTQIETDLEATGGQYFYEMNPTGVDVIFVAFLSNKKRRHVPACCSCDLIQTLGGSLNSSSKRGQVRDCFMVSMGKPNPHLDTAAKVAA